MLPQGRMDQAAFTQAAFSNSLLIIVPDGFVILDVFSAFLHFL
jgi:hypothetical protein